MQAPPKTALPRARAALLRGLALAASLALAPRASFAQTAPRYLAQMQAELQAMGLAPQCVAAGPQAAGCTVRASAPRVEGSPAPTRRFLMQLRYDDATDTIYAYADHYATVRADSADAPRIFRRLLELNWEMLVGKFEWSPSSGEVRLSAVLNTDSNFDRRAFRGVVRSLLRLAERHADELSRLTGNAVGEPIGAAAAPSAAPSRAPSAAPAPSATAAPSAR